MDTVYHHSKNKSIKIPSYFDSDPNSKNMELSTQLIQLMNINCNVLHNIVDLSEKKKYLKEVCYQALNYLLYEWNESI